MLNAGIMNECCRYLFVMQTNVLLFLHIFKKLCKFYIDEYLYIHILFLIKYLISY